MVSIMSANVLFARLAAGYGFDGKLQLSALAKRTFATETRAVALASSLEAYVGVVDQLIRDKRMHPDVLPEYFAKLLSTKVFPTVPFLLETWNAHRNRLRYIRNSQAIARNYAQKRRAAGSGPK